MPPLHTSSSSSGGGSISNSSISSSNTTSSSSNGGATSAAGAPLRVNDFIAATIASATMLGQLRRLMLRYRAMLLPRHVVDFLVAMERILIGGARRPGGGGGSGGTASIAADDEAGGGGDGGGGGAVQHPAPQQQQLPLGAGGLRGSVRVAPAAAPLAAGSLESLGQERQTIMVRGLGRGCVGGPCAPFFDGTVNPGSAGHSSLPYNQPITSAHSS